MTEQLKVRVRNDSLPPHLPKKLLWKWNENWCILNKRLEFIHPLLKYVGVIIMWQMCNTKKINLESSAMQSNKKWINLLQKLTRVSLWSSFFVKGCFWFCLLVIYFTKPTPEELKQFWGGLEAETSYTTTSKNGLLTDITVGIRQTSLLQYGKYYDPEWHDFLVPWMKRGVFLHAMK